MPSATLELGKLTCASRSLWRLLSWLNLSWLMLLQLEQKFCITWKLGQLCFTLHSIVIDINNFEVHLEFMLMSKIHWRIGQVNMQRMGTNWETMLSSLLTWMVWSNKLMTPCCQNYLHPEQWPLLISLLVVQLLCKSLVTL